MIINPYIYSNVTLLQFNVGVTQAIWNSLFLLDSTHLVNADGGESDDGFLRSFSVNSAGSGLAELDKLEHDTLQGFYNSAVKIDDTHFMLAYSGSGSDGFVKTFSVDGSGTIAQIDSLEHDTVNGTYNSLIQLSATHFMLAYAGDGNDGFIKVFSIDGSYNITQVTSLEHDTTAGIWNSLAMIDSTHFVLAYGGAASDGFVKTFSMDAGTYVLTEIDVLEFDLALAQTISIVVIDTTHFAIAYGQNTADGYVKTFSIDGSYDNITQLDSLLYDTVGNWCSMVKIDATHLLVVSRGDNGVGGVRGDIRVFTLDGSYLITESQKETLTDEAITYPSLIALDSTHYAVTYYEATTDNGFLQTFTITV